MAKANLKVMLLRCTPDPDEIVALGARLCYAQADIEALRERVESRDQQKYIAGVMERGHLSVTEHATFTFAVEGVSRALLAQLTRHRIASFSVQSQRYVSMADGFDYVIPPSISALGEEEEAEFIRQMNTMHAWYCQWQEKLGGAKEKANEDADGTLYTCLQAHTSQTGWEPPVVPALWSAKADSGEETNDNTGLMNDEGQTEEA